MARLHLIFLLAFGTTAAFAQSRFKVSYEDLKAYEGKYEYVENTTLSIAASPRDTLLYAVILKGRYPLRPVGKDLFLNNGNDSVRFVRDKENRISGYEVGKERFKLLSRDVVFPKQMWYARLNAGKYVYSRPKNTGDGLATGDLKGSGLNPVLLAEMVNKISSEQYKGVHGILILKSNKLVFEEYFYEYTIDSLHELRSATKSFVSALTGLAIEKEFIGSANDPVLPYFPGYTPANNSALKSQITISHLLSNQSGLDCDITNPDSEGNETKMNYSDDWVKFTLDLPMIDVPGGKGMYCSGNVVTLGKIIENATKMPLPTFADKNLFEPLGIKKFSWNFRPDKSNAEDFCQVYLRPRDMAKLGLVYMNQGKYNGKQIVPANWVKTSLSQHSVVENVNYGYLWWLKYLDSNGVRYEGMAAQGNGGQRIFLFPEQDLVVVTTGGNYNMQSPADELISKYILASFNK
ncbi:serine hydrolase [Dyadobacter sp. CY312]|uniref:serine hydrolase domain-containing protein n=1 Tax=Dyadobacter sp. CY312 TaxID=2907303 RepID=UPI001F2A0400|nr:serine hydrolase [Dyadobacter sp. CY312]MCE7042419.1 beta-lactamase family protein [Dyadobacter sp. CY312]